MPTKGVYQIRVNKVTNFLSKIVVATPTSIIETTNVNPYDIRRMLDDGILTISLNYNHNWLILTKTLRQRKDYWGFYKQRIDKYSRTVPTFHIKRKAKPTLSYIQEAIDMPSPVDHTTLYRAFNDIGEDFLKKMFHKLVIKLYDKGIITSRFLVVDATHIYAYCNTRKDTNKYPVECAAWGVHQGRFYGYKVHILIDADSELPIAMILSSGEDHDSVHFEPLVEEFDKNYDFEEIIAVLADGAYDNEDFRNFVQEKTGGIFLPVCNPRRSKILTMMKQKVKKLFDRHGDKIHSVQDAFKYLGQRFLTHFNIDIGALKENKLLEMIAERLHRPFRAAVERVFSRLKSLNSFTRPKSKRFETVKRTIWWCLIGALAQALTAHEKGLPYAMRKRTVLV